MSQEDQFYFPIGHFNNIETAKDSDLTGSKRQVNLESIYKYILLNASKSDTANVDYNKYGTKGF